jgi:hypothetical protein
MSITNLKKVTRFSVLDNPSYWIFFDGTKVIVYEGEYGNTKSSTKYFQLNGTSGGTGYQIASHQHLKDKGPVPEGDYSVNLGLDPTRSVNMDNNAQTSGSIGVQQMLTKDYRGNLAWGRWRARLEKVNVQTTRDNFYFHDSYKGHSHGCIETEASLYYFFYSLHAQGYTSIKVKVDYPSNSTRTNGGTEQTSFKLPTNVKELLKRYSYLPSGDPKKIPWMPWPVDKSYRFVSTFYTVTKYKQ